MLDQYCPVRLAMTLQGLSHLLPPENLKQEMLGIEPEEGLSTAGISKAGAPPWFVPSIRFWLPMNRYVLF